MKSLQNFSGNVNVTLSQSDLVDLINTCLTKNSFIQEKQLPVHFSIKQLSEYLNYSEPTIYKMVGQSLIPCYKLSGKILFKRTEIDEWLLDFRKATTKQCFTVLDNKCK